MTDNIDVPGPFSGSTKWTSDVLGVGMVMSPTGDWTYLPNLPDDDSASDEPNDGDE